ncbi:AAA family ATPase [Streptomyces sp. NBC_01707]|uniref:AAA family ATPase n=1 Tax=unclassified Streptomyces TaxID=2593676 RepID=UPI002E0D353F|nr:AAA family ATPase [Streptomyces sp. NBC_01230]
MNGKTPVEAWQADATPLTDVSTAQLATFALEDDGRTYTITTSGVRWRRRDYLAPWMNGRTGTKVSVRHLRHHDDTIELFDATTGHHLGSAFLAAAASREQIRSVQAARTAAARRLKADLKAAEKLRRQRFEASKASHFFDLRAGQRGTGRGSADGPPRAGPSRSRNKLMIADLDYGLLPDESEDHFLGLEQAQLVGTDTLLTTRDNIEAVIEAKAMMCVYGPAGSGKTMSVNSALRHLAPDITHRLELRAGPTPRDIRHGLFQALGLPGEPPARPIEFDTLLKEALAEEFRVLVCDEAQWMKKTGFEFWRHLWDDKRTNIAVIFAGGDGCYKVLRREPMLATRIFIWQEFTRMSKDEVRTTIPAFHPVWTDVDTALIDAIDKQAAHGSFRNWANITTHVLAGMKKLNLKQVDENLVRWVYSKIGGM